MLNDRYSGDLKKIKYKYGEKDFGEFLKALEKLYYIPLPLEDVFGEKLVLCDGSAHAKDGAVKLLLKPQEGRYGVSAAEDEIVATSAIESVDFSRDSVRRILKGFAPQDEEELRITGLKRGLDFISDTAYEITEENLYRLYMTAVGSFLSEENRLKDGRFYRNGPVFVVSDRVEHKGADCRKLPRYMRALVDFANADDGINDLFKAAVIHFYIAYLHPYFDGNGRMARLVHLWFLIRKGYRSALFIPFSSSIEKSRKAYYNAFTLIEENRKISGKTDVTPFITYFVNHVYNKMTDGAPPLDLFAAYDEAVRRGAVTEKETRLWKFVLSFYGDREFSTKQLEKDFGNAAYATVRGFVLKFKELGLLTSVNYGVRVKYRIKK